MRYLIAGGLAALVALASVDPAGTARGALTGAVVGMAFVAVAWAAAYLSGRLD